MKEFTRQNLGIALCGIMMLTNLAVIAVCVAGTLKSSK